jgi:hypothetical protein
MLCCDALAMYCDGDQLLSVGVSDSTTNLTQLNRLILIQCLNVSGATKTRMRAVSCI